jgi:hypothetical protein
MTPPLPAGLTAWRCFPWNTAARSGEPLSPSYLPPGQRTGRFDLSDQPSILYLSDDSAHVVAETLQAFRNLVFLLGMLRRHGHPLAVIDVTIGASLRNRLADLCDPATLSRLGITPDLTAHHDRAVTQPLARRIYEAAERYAGLRWWSTLTGAWHTIALFADRLPPEAITFGTPRLLTPSDADVSAARQLLNLH